MESLLSRSFDYISSNDAGKMRKGLRQLEGLLAQICITRAGSSASPDKRRSMAPQQNHELKAKQLSELKDDPAFREFFKLQEGFQWNVALRLTSCLEKCLGKSNNGQNDLLIVSTLDLLHGILLIHPPSRSIFARESTMELLLDLLDPVLCPAIHGKTLLTLVTALLASPANTRTFESLDGLLTITSLFKSRSASREVKVKSVEFLYFYLMPETPPSSASAAYVGADGVWGVGPRSPSKSQMIIGEGSTRTTEEKQKLLGRYLGNVDDLVEDLRESAPFGTAV